MNRPLMGLASLLMAFAGFYQEFSPYDDDYAPLDNAKQVAPRQEPLGCLVNQTPVAEGQDVPSLPQEAAAAIVYMTEDEARATGKAVWIHFMDTDCPPCKVVEKIHQDPAVIEASKNFACVLMCWCDDSLHDRIRAYGVKGFPKDCFVYPDGMMKTPRQSPMDVAGTLEMLGEGNERSILVEEYDYSAVVKVHIPLGNIGGNSYRATGSGVVVEREGRQFVVTNHHVVSEGDRSRLRVSTSEGQEFSASVLVEDSVMDLAVLDAGKVSERPAEAVQVEKWSTDALFYGCGYGGLRSPHRHLLQPMTWTNIGSGKWSFVMFQNANCDGDSGGPIFDGQGRVVGVMWGHSTKEENNHTMGTCGQPFLEIIDKAAEVSGEKTRLVARGRRSYSRRGRLGGGPIFLPRLRFAPQ